MITTASHPALHLALAEGGVAQFGPFALILLVPAAFVLYSTTAHYQRPTAPLAFDTLAFVSALGLVITLALSAPWPWLTALLLAPVVLFLSVFFVGNKLCYRFFKDWVHHQMILEWRAGAPIAVDAWKQMQPWEWIGGVAIPLGATVAVLLYGRPAPWAWALPVSLALVTIGALGHRGTRSRSFETDEHNPIMNFVRGWLGEFKGVSARRAAQAAPHVRPTPSHGYRYADGPQFPLVQEPIQGWPSSPPRLHTRGRPPNIVLIVLESVRALECGAYGARTSFTPNFDRLAADGLLLKNFYANGSQTVRGELALLCSFYDQFGGSPLYLRHPGIRIRGLPEILREQGYRTLWISSYTADFHNKRRFLENHGVDEVHDDRGMPGGLPKINWGPPDEELFKYATEILDRQTTPFFAEVMTLTNHWPFQGPYPTSDRTPVVCKDKLYTDFTRGVYYTDHALGRFIDSVRDKPWFRDTIFAITSDHGAWIYPDALKLNPLQKQEAYFRMPMLLYAPGLIEPGVIDTVTSQVDFAPTVLDLLGVRARNAFIGRSAFDPEAASRRSALMFHWHSWNLRVGDRYLYTVGKSFAGHNNRCARPDDSAERTGTSYACFTECEDLLTKADVSTVIPEPGAEMERLTRWADDLLCVTDHLRVHNRVYDRPMEEPARDDSSRLPTPAVQQGVA